MKKALFMLVLVSFFVGCEEKSNEEQANTPPSLPGAGSPPVFNEN